MEHALPSLPFEKDALAPHISEETFDFHHAKHHQAYVTNLNNLIKNTEYAELELEAIVRKAPSVASTTTPRKCGITAFSGTA